MEDEAGKSFGELLRGLREASGLSREELAGRAGLSAKAIGALERGERRRPHPHTFRVLADALGLSGESRNELFAAIPGRNVAAAREAPAGGAALPLPPTRLLGRSGEVEAVGRLLLEEARLVTLVGAGGVGKTRLALEVAGRVAGSFSDGVAFVSLAPLADAGLVVPEISRALGVREAPGRPARDALRGRLRDGRTLLVLDNFEHLLGAATEVSTLLASCPHLRVLATSREALGLRGERRFPVPPLEVPAPSRSPAPAEVASAAAAQLFVERAREVAPGFEITRQNAVAVAEICRRLDGLPLAIELAAAMLRALPPEGVLARLDAAMPSLAGGPRDLPERQHTIRRTVEWSYDLLDESEKTAFARLSVFSGGFSPEAAEAVLEPLPGRGEPSGFAALAPVLALLDKSLLVAGAPDEARFGMLETIRSYGLERLAEGGEERSVRGRHARYFLALAEEAEAHLNSPDRDAWMSRLETEQDNLRSALAHSLSEGRAETALRLSGALLWFWLNGGHWSEGRRWFERALGSAAAQAGAVAPEVRAKALYGAGTLACLQGDYAVSSPLLAESAALWREIGDPSGLAYTLVFRHGEALSKGEVDEALSFIEESVALFRGTEDAFGLAVALANLGATYRAMGEYARARRALEESALIARELDDDWLLALPLQNLGVVTFKQGEPERAEAYLKESLLPSVRRSGEEWFGAHTVEVLATLAASRGDHQRAARLYGAAEAMREEVGSTVLPYEATDREQGMATAREALGGEAFAAAQAEGRAMTPEIRIAEALGELPFDGAAHYQARRKRYDAPKDVGTGI